MILLRLTTSSVSRSRFDWRIGQIPERIKIGCGRRRAINSDIFDDKVQIGLDFGGIKPAETMTLRVRRDDEIAYDLKIGPNDVRLNQGRDEFNLVGNGHIRIVERKFPALQSGTHEALYDVRIFGEVVFAGPDTVRIEFKPMIGGKKGLQFSMAVFCARLKTGSRHEEEFNRRHCLSHQCAGARRRSDIDNAQRVWI